MIPMLRHSSSFEARPQRASVFTKQHLPLLFLLFIAVGSSFALGQSSNISLGTSSRQDALHRRKMILANSNSSTLHVPNVKAMDSGATTGIISTIAGGTNDVATKTVCANKTDNMGDGCPATNAILSNYFEHITVDQYGNIYIPDTGFAVVRFIYGGVSAPAFLSAEGITNPVKGNIYLIAGQNTNATCAQSDGGGTGNSSTCGDGYLATSAYLDQPFAVSLDSTGNLYIVDGSEQVIRKVDASTGYISRFAGTYFTSSDASATGMVIDSNGNLYIVGEQVIRKINTADGTISAVAGTAGISCADETTACGDGGQATNAQLNYPKGVFVDSSGNIYIADQSDDRIRVVYEAGTVAQLTALGITAANGNLHVGYIYTIVGDGYECSESLVASCYDGQSALGNPTVDVNGDGPVDYPTDIAVDSTGNIFIVDSDDYAIRKIDTSDIISTVAGTLLQSGYGGDGGLATASGALLSSTPQGLALDAEGNLYIADTANSVIRYVPGVAAVTTFSQTVTWNQTLSDVTYGSTNTVTLSGASASSGLTTSYSVVSGPATITGSTLAITGAGTVEVEAVQTGGTVGFKTYSAANSTPMSFNVNKATLTVTANEVSVPFGTDPSALASTYETYKTSGLASGDSLAGAPAYSITNCSDGNATYTATTVAGTTCTITPTVNTLAISPSTQASSYYSPFTYVSATLTVVGGAAQTITFPKLTGTFTYGMSPIALGATATSKQPVSYSVDNTSVATITGDSTSGYYLTIKGAGQVTVTASQGGNNNYAPAQSVSQVLTIGRATVTVTAGSFSAGYGSTLTSSQFSYTASSLVATNDQFSGTPTYTTNCGGGAAYSTTTAVGTNCTISVSGLSISPTSDAGNYTISYATGTLTVIQGTQSISWVQPGNVTYPGGATQTVTLTASATSGLPLSATVLSGPAAVVSGTTVQTTGGGAVLGVGTVTVQLSQAGNSNYAAASPVTVSFMVEPATLYVKANDLTMAPGATVPTLTWSFTCDSSGSNSCNGAYFVGTDTNTAAVVSGLPVLTTTATSTSPANTYPITITQGTLYAQNYTISPVNGTLTVTSAPTYIVTANPSTLTIRAGQTGQASIIVTPTNNYQGTITFTCGNLPANVTCTFSPASLTLTPTSSGSVTAQQTTLTVNTNASSTVVGMLAPHQGSQVLTASLFFLPGGLTGLLIAFNRKRLRKYRGWQAMLILGVLLSGLMGLSACGGSTTKDVATAGTNTVTISAAGTGTTGSGSPNATTSLNLTINIVQ